MIPCLSEHDSCKLDGPCEGKRAYDRRESTYALLSVYCLMTSDAGLRVENRYRGVRGLPPLPSQRETVPPGNPCIMQGTVTRT